MLGRHLTEVPRDAHGVFERDRHAPRAELRRALAAVATGRRQLREPAFLALVRVLRVLLLRLRELLHVHSRDGVEADGAHHRFGGGARLAQDPSGALPDRFPSQALAALLQPQPHARGAPALPAREPKGGALEQGPPPLLLEVYRARVRRRLDPPQLRRRSLLLAAAQRALLHQEALQLRHLHQLLPLRARRVHELVPRRTVRLPAPPLALRLRLLDPYRNLPWPVRARLRKGRRLLIDVVAAVETPALVSSGARRHLFEPLHRHPRRRRVHAARQEREPQNELGGAPALQWHRQRHVWLVQRNSELVVPQRNLRRR
mmetsp:Transcript_7029/g.23330  ORF Transcript_7029/g.23330 Transcript_7029/m.23330 type:complete len:317 (+) Transcript_7029:715-1665(+)